MKRLPAPRLIARYSAAILLAALMLAPAVVRAQGGFLKKAKDKIIGKPAPTSPPPEFNETLLELTDERIDGFLRGMAAGRAVKGPGGLTVAELTRQADEAFSKRNKLLDGKDDEISKYNDAVNKNEECFTEELSAIEKQREKEMSGRMASMKAADLQVIQKFTMEMGQKMAAGDTAGAMAAQTAMMVHFGIDTKADSAKAHAKCGPPPPKPGWMTQAEGLYAAGNSAMKAARDADQQSGAEQASKSGMNGKQYSLVKERIIAFTNADGKPPANWRFSDSERQRLSQRLESIRSALKQ